MGQERMKFLEDLLWEMGEDKRRKRQEKWERSECAAGRHNMRDYSGLPSYFYRYRVCERFRCDYAVENPDYDAAKGDKWIKVAQAKEAARKKAGRAICKVKGHDMEYLPSPDWMGWCRRCGWHDS